MDLRILVNSTKEDPFLPPAISTSALYGFVQAIACQALSQHIMKLVHFCELEDLKLRLGFNEI